MTAVTHCRVVRMVGGQALTLYGVDCGPGCHAPSCRASMFRADVGIFMVVRQPTAPLAAVLNREAIGIVFDENADRYDHMTWPGGTA